MKKKKLRIHELNVTQKSALFLVPVKLLLVLPAVQFFFGTKLKNLWSLSPC